MLRALSEEAEVVSSARGTAETIAVLISNRLNTSIVLKIQDVIDEAHLLLEMANQLMGQAQSNAQVAQNVSRSLDGLGSGLMAAGKVAVDTLRVTSGAIGIIRDTTAVEEILTVSRPTQFFFLSTLLAF